MSKPQPQHISMRADSNWGEPPTLTQRIDRSLSGAPSRRLLRNDRQNSDAIDLRSNDFLSLSGHPSIIDAQIAELKGGGDNIYMSAAFLSESTMQRAVERKMAAFLETEDAVLCQSGWCANVGLMHTITDQHTHVYLDQFVHAGMWDGVRSTGSSVHPFRHNNPQHLEDLIKEYGAGVIVVSSIYPGNGLVCPLADVADIAVQRGCELAVDESHTMGVYGRHGEGLVSALGLADKVNYRIFSLSKAMVTRAGMVAGPARIVDFFRYESRPAIFSSAVLQYEIAGLAAALNVIQEEDWRRERLRGNTLSLRAELAKSNFDVLSDDSQIIPIFAGSESDAIELHAALERNNLFSTIISKPDVSKKGSFVRLSVNSSLSEEDIHRVVDICTRVCGPLQSVNIRQRR